MTHLRELDVNLADTIPLVVLLEAGEVLAAAGHLSNTTQERVSNAEKGRNQ